MLRSIATSALFFRNRTILFMQKYEFSRRAKNSQLILHTPEQIENMISKKNNKLAVRN